MYHNYSPENPFRPVHWRWERAGLVVDGTLPLSRKRDNDAWVTKAVKFRKRYQACAAQLDFTLLSEDEPAIYWAHDLWRANPANLYHTVIKHHVEARLLADDTDEGIFEWCDISPAVAVAYEKLFFNVRPKLHKQGYILNQVLAPAITRGLHARDYDLLWKLYGYLRGEHMLNYVVSGWSKPRYKAPLADLEHIRELDQNTELGIQAAITTKTLKIHSESQGEIIKLHQDLKRLEVAKGAGTAGANDAITSAIQVFLGTNNAFVCGPPTKHESPSRMLEYDKGAVELGSEDLLLVADGREPTFDPLLAEATFPPPGVREVHPVT